MNELAIVGLLDERSNSDNGEAAAEEDSECPAGIDDSGSDASEVETVTGRELAPQAARDCSNGAGVYQWWEEENRAVRGKVIKISTENADKWQQVFEVDFDIDNGNGVFDCDYGDLFSERGACESTHKQFNKRKRSKGN